ncbi:polysaccharide biosynthesis tyrosine autokinase [Mucilaginibacter sp.]|uniref:polysaccharide biosynthesis tyrosine autokinase n=1 Tax=Mucilaginibacter sp. TaxID=1882438 RepID=UPI003D0AA87B
MEEISKSKAQNKLPNQEIDYFKVAKIFVSRWYWIAGSIVVCMITANIYLWYTPKIYATFGTMKLEEKKSELPDLAGVMPVSDRANTSRVQSETIVMQSNALLLNAIKHLDYRMSFYIIGRVLNRTNELYPQKPLDVELIKFDSLNFYHDIITFKPINEKSFSLSYKLAGKDVLRTYAYNIPFMIGPTGFNISAPSVISKNTSYLFKLNAPEDFIDRVRGGLHIAETAKNSNIIALQETDPNPQFASDVLNAVMTEYLTYDRIQKMQSATQMIDFIDSQLKYLSDRVAVSEKSMEKYKQNLKIVDVSTAATAAISKADNLESQKSLLNIQLIAIDQLKADIIKEKNNVTLNFNMEGVVDPQLQLAINKLDNLIYARNSLLKTYNANAQPINDINQQILQIKSTAINDINISRNIVEKNIKYISDQLGQVNEKVTHFPVAENDMAGLQRSFSVNEKVYDLLSEKKLNAQISRSGILPGATIIDLSQPNYNPVSPDENGIKRSSIIFGICIGIGLIVLIRILNPFIYDKETIESLTSIPIIGVIRKFPEEIDEYSTQILAISKPKSIFAESVRSVRTNLSFLASNKTSKVICITSEVAGEGKSFVAVNLASTLSLIDKKVILVAADLRRSKLHKTFNVPNDVGLSSYLSNQLSANEVISKSNQKNLDFIISGPIPPNPSELLHSKRMTELIDDLTSRYDIVMIDTAPIGLVSDAIPLIRISDINLFVIRSGKSKFYAATIPQRIAQEYNLDNTVIVLNAFEQDLLHSRYYNTKFSGESYAGKYYYYSDYTGYESSGYYIDNKDLKWWDIRRLFKR